MALTSRFSVLLLATCAAFVASAPVNARSHKAERAFVQEALAMRGQPYRYGGDRPGGFDCSGLVKYAASRVGVDLPRTTRELTTVGRKVARSKMRAGDLVFFHGGAGRPDHVGIYLGDGRFVHAPSSGREVSIDDLQDAWYQRNWWQARRLRLR